ncbi:MAG: hypothetical protein C4547_04130 [Phycisphaerales bacterium]|nr:MAG: hypothetical protein C4547_04130 [Phycisphaerales bacterium]
MITPWNCDRSRPWGRRAVSWGLLAAVSASAGCGMTQGKLLYFLGFGQGRKVEAKYTLTQGPVLILVDDADGIVDWPVAIRLLQDDLAQALLKTKSAQKIVPVQTVQALRQTTADFDKRGIREVGRMAGAEQVLWLGVDEFFITEEPHEVHDAAYFVVSVKVINALEDEDRLRVRLWPDESEGFRILARVSAGEAAKAKSRDAISKLLTGRLAENIARLFHDHRLGDFERPT